VLVSNSSLLLDHQSESVISPVVNCSTTERRYIKFRARFIAGIFWIIVVTSISQGSNFLCMLISARLLGHENFGRLAMIQSIVLTITGFAGMALGATATKFVSEYRSQDPARVGRILGLCTITTMITGAIYAVGLIILAPWIVEKLLHAAEMSFPLMLGAIYVLFSTLNGYQVGAICGFEAFTRLARINFILAPSMIILTIVFTWFLGLSGVILAFGISMGCSWFLHQMALQTECARFGVRIVYTNLRAELPFLWRFALPAALSGYVGGLALTGSNTMLIRESGAFAQMALFNAAYTIRVLVLLLPGIVSRVSGPILCNIRVSSGARSYRRTFWAYLGFNAGLTTLASLFLAALGPWILSWFGEEFVQGNKILSLVLASAVAEALATTLYQPLYNHGKMWSQLAIAVVWSILLAGGTWCTVARGGAMALATSYLVAWTCTSMLYALVTRKLLRVETDRNLKTLISSI